MTERTIVSFVCGICRGRKRSALGQLVDTPTGVRFKSATFKQAVMKASTTVTYGPDGRKVTEENEPITVERRPEQIDLSLAEFGDAQLVRCRASHPVWIDRAVVESAEARYRATGSRPIIPVDRTIG